METTEKSSWEEFCSDFLDEGWFAVEDRRKTLSAMWKLWERMPQEDRDKLPPGIIVFAPRPSKLGEAIPFFHSGLHGPSAFIYLSPSLEKMPQAKVDSIVAHEFAHVVLGHHHPPSASLPKTHGDLPAERKTVSRWPKTHGDFPEERETDELITRWGFEPAYESNRKKRR